MHLARVVHRSTGSDKSLCDGLSAKDTARSVRTPPADEAVSSLGFQIQQENKVCDKLFRRV